MSDDEKTRVSKQIGPSAQNEITEISFDADLTERAPDSISVPANAASSEIGADDKTLVAGSDDATLLSGAASAATQISIAGGDGDFFVDDGGSLNADVSALRFDVGSVLKDRFRLEKKLGEGGMGAVFLAVDQRKLEAKHQDPYVAIKLISGDFSQDPMAYISLQRETDKSQKLAHPNIITVYDFDRDGDVFFMTMEALKGRTLDQIIKDREHCKLHAAEYIAAIAQGIAYAHKRNIVHSDLKPPNIFVTEDGVVKVLDFGIARALYGSGDELGEVIGLTPSYASCEMFEEAAPHTSDDVYAMGVIAYQLYTGEHPFAKKKAILARDQGLRPKRIKGIPHYQWRAISDALAFRRDARCADAGQFYRRFTGAGRRIRQLSVAVFALLLGFGGFLALYKPELGPEIPFDQLPIAVQQQFSAHLAEADLAMRFKDVNGALFYLDRAYVLHPHNPQVVKKIEVLVADMTAMILAAPATPEQRVQQVDELLKYESLAQNSSLLSLKKSLVTSPQSQ